MKKTPKKTIITQSATYEAAAPKTASGTVKTVAVFAAYLLTALPYNMAMAANWQTPEQVASLENGGTPQASDITVNTSDAQPSRFYQITYDDVEQEVARELTAQGVEKKVRAFSAPANSPMLYAADHPLKLSLHALQVDPGTHQWQAQAYVLSGGKTEIVKPVSGRYEAVVAVPVLSRQLSGTDTIEASDLTTRDMPSRQLRKDTITDTSQLIGKSPRGNISAGRPIRSAEVTAPIVIKKGDAVELSYSSPYLSIKTTGIALENGEQGGLVRVKNEQTEKAVTGRALSTGRVEVNLQAGS